MEPLPLALDHNPASPAYGFTAHVTDPEGYRIIVFDGESELVAAFGLYGLDTGSFTLPSDVEVDGDGNIYVTDTDGQRVMRFGPLP